MTNTEVNFINEIFINRLAQCASSLFGIQSSISKHIASKYINNGYVNLNDDLLNHSGIESYTVPMLLKYHILNKKQLLQRQK